ncbi:MAG: MarR family transcriptional regulator [Alphaproteobacteria bacterium]|nr:MarR family transcriptional regulator [Alphaproteobacteria bacterium]MBO6864840.1 MarR family transcriptional regulator [Alphaproteobacteria bacterium]
MDLNLDRFLPYRLSVLADRVTRDLSKVYGPRGIGQAEWRVLAHLGGAADGLSVRDIHDRVSLEKYRVTRALQRLESAGLVRKTQSDRDRRLIAVALTAAGRAFYDRIVPDVLAFEQTLLSVLSEEERTLFDRVLDRLTEMDSATRPLGRE